MNIRPEILACLVGVGTAAAEAQEMVRVPGGTFVMGSNGGPADERPAHTAHLREFEIDRVPVTNADFAKFLEHVGAQAGDGTRYYDWDDNDARIHRAGGTWRADAGREDPRPGPVRATRGGRPRLARR